MESFEDDAKSRREMSICTVSAREKLNEDFYAMTFFSIIWHDEGLRKEIKGVRVEELIDRRTKQVMEVGENEMAKSFMSCFFICFIQVFLTSMLF